MEPSTRYDSFLHAFDEVAAQSSAEGGSIALLLFDVDWCGRVNRDHGHAAGDASITALGARLEVTLDNAACIVRCGGDAYVALLPGVEKEEAFLQAERVRAVIEKEPIALTGGDTVAWSVSVSAGVAVYPDDGGKAGDVFRKASEALYRAKIGGRNRVCLSREERMVTKTSYYTQGQLAGLSRLAKREGLNEAVLLREALDDLLRKYNA
ncbi:MAG: diguanylate cyclase [Candidatus Hydrogenedentes bacterium]|nr:diguanylate cyclase [Candidatus Hydrogenedentota bacterium]